MFGCRTGSEAENRNWKTETGCCERSFLKVDPRNLGEIVEVGDAGACRAVLEFFRAWDVFRDGSAHGRVHGGGARTEDAAGDHRPRGAGRRWIPRLAPTGRRSAI